MNDETRAPWRRIQWIDVVLVVITIAVLLFLTMELWLPHFGVHQSRTSFTSHGVWSQASAGPGKRDNDRVDANNFAL